MNLTKKQIDEIVSKNEITETISKYIKLDKRGSNFVAICPFHDDSTPSMYINKVKQIYKCFSCGVAGNSLDFIKRYENIVFPVALKKAAKNANLTFTALNNYFSNNTKKYLSNELKTFEINQLTMKFFKNSLNCEVGNSAYKYLEERNFSQNEIAKFDIGYATKNPELSNFLEKHGYSVFEINQSGLLNDHNSCFDFFNDRLMFPIKNKEGHVIGFSGRTIGEPLNGIPKYINTSETHVFKKNNLMYNIDRSKNDIKKADEIIILEGFIDVIALSKLDINNTVALMGTNLSDFHIKEISKLTNNIVLFLDGDKPGMDATLKLSKQLLDVNLTVNVVNNATNKDPAELVQSNENIVQMINDKMHPITWLMKRTKNMYNLLDLNSIKKYIYLIGNMLISIKDPITKEFYLNILAKETKTSFEMVKNIIGIKTKSSLNSNEYQNVNNSFQKNIVSNTDFTESCTSVILNIRDYYDSLINEIKQYLKYENNFTDYEINQLTKYLDLTEKMKYYKIITLISSSKEQDIKNIKLIEQEFNEMVFKVNPIMQKGYNLINTLGKDR